MSSVNATTLVPLSREILFRQLCDIEMYSGRVAGTLKMELTGPAFPMKKGAEYEFLVERLGFRQFWHLQIEVCESPREIVLRQSLGVFTHWTHTFRLVVFDEKTTKLEQSVDYRMPLGLIGRLYDDLSLRKFIERVLTKFADSFCKESHD